MPTVSVIIPLWNGEQWIASCLDALLGQADSTRFALDVIVVDNGSIDDSPKRVETAFPAVQLIRAGRNLGFAGGCNVGVDAAAGDVLVLLNQDTVVQPGWLTGLVDGLANPAVGVAGSTALDASGRRVQHAGGAVDWPLGVARHLGQGESYHPRRLQNADVEFVTGASFAFTRALLERIGPLDAGFWPGYYEDVDYCRRAQAAGFGVRLVAGSVLRHAESGSFTDSAYSAYARLRGRLRFCLKHLPPHRFVDEFLPAEAAYQSTVLAGDERGTIARAYLEAIPMALSLWQGRGATDAEISAAAAGLAALCPRPNPPLPTSLFPREQEIPAPAPPTLTPSRLDGIPLLGPARRGLHRLAIFYSERRQRELLALARGQQATIRRMRAEIDRLRSDSPGRDVDA